jgi:hypothetical protein
MIFYHTKQNFSVCYCTILTLGDNGKYFAIVKQKVIFPISQIVILYSSFSAEMSNTLSSIESVKQIVIDRDVFVSGKDGNRQGSMGR